MILGVLLLCDIGFSQQASAEIVTIAKSRQTKQVTIATNRSLVLNIGEEFTEISVARPEIADVAALSKTRFIFSARCRAEPI